MATNETISQMLRLMGEVWPRDGERTSALTVEVYSRVLADMDDEIVRAGVIDMLTRATFWPKPAEIRSACLALLYPAEMTGIEAWGALCKWLRRWPAGGRWAAGQHFDPPALPERIQRAAEAVGGVEYLRLSEDAVTDRARFVQAYEAITGRVRARAQMLPEVRAVVERIGWGRHLLALEEGS